MTYPPEWRVVTDVEAVLAVVREHPFAHLITVDDVAHATRIPLIVDVADGRIVTARGHMNRSNPQASGLDGSEALILFDGHATYVSPNWRVDRSRAATYDYEQVRLRGIVKVASSLDFFRRQVDDLAALIEPQYGEVGDYPLWQTSSSPPGYLERLHPAVIAFEVTVQEVQMISKLHQPFDEADRRSIADHLARSHREDARSIAEKIRGQLSRGACPHTDRSAG